MHYCICPVCHNKENVCRTEPSSAKYCFSLPIHHANTHNPDECLLIWYSKYHISRYRWSIYSMTGQCISHQKLHWYRNFIWYCNGGSLTYAPQNQIIRTSRQYSVLQYWKSTGNFIAYEFYSRVLLTKCK